MYANIKVTIHEYRNNPSNLKHLKCDNKKQGYNENDATYRVKIIIIYIIKFECTSFSFLQRITLTLKHVYKFIIACCK